MVMENLRSVLTNFARHLCIGLLSFGAILIIFTKLPSEPISKANVKTSGVFLVERMKRNAFSPRQLRTCQLFHERINITTYEDSIS